jgi:SAM-dependent methyltransferase
VAGRSPREVVDDHEASLGSDLRRRQGAHYTPDALAARIVDLGWRALGRMPRRVCDPSCGAGAVLLAAAERFADAGVPPEEVVERRLVGFDIDPGAVAAARAALREWARRHGVDAARPVVVHQDSLLDPPSIPAGDPVDLICGNPPFLTQLHRDTALQPRDRVRLAERWPQLGAYTDAAGLHLLAAMDLVEAGGAVALLQPRSVLGSRDGAPVREAVARRGSLVALWSTPVSLFRDAAVRVCLPVVRVAPREAAGAGTVPATSDGRVEVILGDGDVRAVSAPSPPTAWSALLATMEGAPRVDPSVATGALGELVRATAGFRDEFYALTAVAEEGPEGGRPLVTVGMIDPAELRWGDGPRRLGGRRLRSPVVPESFLRAGSSGVAGWARRRLVPKVLVATQTRVLEVVLDRRGDLVPLTPVISLEVIGAGAGGAELLEAVAAALSAPCVSALLAHRVAGTGLGHDALRPSARVLEGLPIPEEVARRTELARAWRALEARHPADRFGEDVWMEFARRSDAAYGVDDEQLLRWWWGRHPAARRGRGARRSDDGALPT